MNLPNKLTVLRVLLIPVFLYFFFAAENPWFYDFAAGTSAILPSGYLLALIVFAAASITDLLDGKIARKRGLVTDFGKLMDPLADKLLVMAAMICFVAVEIVHPIIVILILAREFLVTSIRLVAAGGGAVLAADGWGKAKTAFQMVWICYGLLLKALNNMTALVLPNACYWLYILLLAAVTVLTVVSGVNYTVKNRNLFADM